MARPTNGAAGSYHVVYPGIVRSFLRTLGRQASKAGMAREVADALREIDGRLRTDPVGFGDPSCRLRHLGLLKCLGFCQPLYVYYAVDDVRRIVYVTEFRPSPGSFLNAPPDPSDNG